MYCEKCGNKLLDGELMCSNCGLKKNISKRNKKNRKMMIFILSVIVLIFLIITIILNLNNKHYSSDVVGNWKCKKYSWTSDSVNNGYVLNLQLNNNKTFLWEDIVSLSKYYVKGSYNATIEKKENLQYNNSKSYRLDLKAKDTNISQLKNGKTISYELQILSDNSTAVLINFSNYSTYYCDKM